MDEFKGNEPQTDTPKVVLPPQMLEEMSRYLTSPNDSAGQIREPSVGCVISFTGLSHLPYAAVRTGEGWRVSGARDLHTWAQLLSVARDPIFVMTPLVALHP